MKTPMAISPLLNVALAICAGGTAATAQTVFFVDQDAPGPGQNGASWCTAYHSVSDALDVAMPGDEVRVAAGLYLPSTSGLPDARVATFALPDGVTLIGGFAGCGAADPGEHDTLTHRTVLSCDLGGDDLPNFGNRSDNCRNVVYVLASGPGTRLEGLTLRSGQADGTFATSDGSGGGLFIDSSMLEVVDCTIQDNAAQWGGGVFAENSILEIRHSSLMDNLASSDKLAYGGALHSRQSEVAIFNCLVTGNTSGAADQVGFGGAINAFQGGVASAMLTVSNSTIADNFAADSGGGIFAAGAVISLDSILWGNTDGTASSVEDAQLFSTTPGTASVTYTCVMGLQTLVGTGNTSADPLFAPGPLGDYYLRPGAASRYSSSPCIDAGSQTAAVAGLDNRTTSIFEAPDEGAVDAGYHYPITGNPLAWGDLNRDGSVDLAEIAVMQRCYSGADSPLTDPACTLFDADFDLDLDLLDYHEVEPGILGP